MRYRERLLITCKYVAAPRPSPINQQTPNQSQYKAYAQRKIFIPDQNIEQSELIRCNVAETPMNSEVLDDDYQLAEIRDHIESSYEYEFYEKSSVIQLSDVNTSINLNCDHDTTGKYTVSPKHSFSQIDAFSAPQVTLVTTETQFQKGKCNFYSEI